MKINYQYLIAAIVLFLIEVAIALFLHDKFIRPYFGDFLVVMLIYCSLKAVIDISVTTAAIIVLLFSYFVELTQYFNLIEVVGLQRSELARAIMGTGFSWLDMIAYTMGIGVVVAAEAIINNKRKPVESVE